MEILSSLLTIRWIQLTLNVVNVLIARHLEQDAWCDLADPAHLSWGVVDSVILENSSLKSLGCRYNDTWYEALSTTAFDILRYRDVLCEDAITHQHHITVSAPVSSLCDLCHHLTANSPSTKWVVTQTPNVKCSNQFFLQPFIFVDKRYLFVSCRSVILASYLASRCNVVWKKNYLQSISALLKFLLQHAVRIARSKVLLSVAHLLLFIS